MNKGYECTDWYFCTMSLYPGPVRRTYAANRTFTAGDFPRRFFLRGIYTSILLLTTILIIYYIQLPSSKPEGASCTSCLFFSSDAADDMLCVVFGGRCFFFL